MLIGRLTREPESIGSNGQTSGARFGFAVNNRRKNQQTGQYEDVPCWIECTAWNKGDNKQGDRVVQTLHKGSQIFIEGHLNFEEWDDKNGGGKRTALKVVVDNFQYLEPKPEGQPQQQHAGRQQPQQGNQQGRQQQPQGRQQGGSGQPQQRGGYNNGYGGGDYDAPDDTQHSGGRHGSSDDDDIPF
jgi:single-strand DNA-binding protein